ncbi:MAG: hypothetical protein WCF04_13295, partial [Candidatus Nanopelagicales bacterium]
MTDEQRPIVPDPDRQTPDETRSDAGQEWVAPAPAIDETTPVEQVPSEPPTGWQTPGGAPFNTGPSGAPSAGAKPAGPDWYQTSTYPTGFDAYGQPTTGQAWGAYPGGPGQPAAAYPAGPGQPAAAYPGGPGQPAAAYPGGPG